MQNTALGAFVGLEETDLGLENVVEVSKGREASQEVRGGRRHQREGGHENLGVVFVRDFT